jgi:hypothetical protein
LSQNTFQVSNPFQYGRPVPPNRFKGRRKQFREIRNKFGAYTAECLSIIGLRRNGKTSLLTYVHDRPLEFCDSDQRPIIVLIDLQDSRFETPAGLLEVLKRDIAKATGTSPWSDNDNRFEVYDGLSRLAAAQYRLIILLDEFECIGRRLNVFQGWGADWRSKISRGLFVLGVCSQRPIAEIYQSWGLDSPFDNVFIETTLGAFEEAEWHTLVIEGFTKTSKPLEESDLLLIYDLSGGLPYFTQMAAYLLWELEDHAATREAFRNQSVRRFADIWRSLTPLEQHALRYASGTSRLASPTPNVITSLQPHGLVRPDGSLFSSAFAEFVRNQL